MANETRSVSASMVSVGVRLKDAREKRSLTIDQVQKKTSIHSTVLRALEEGRCDEILTPTYVKSFLKKYAEYLGLDLRDILSEYATAHPSPTVSAIGKIEPSPDARRSRYRSVLKFGSIYILAVIIAMVFASKLFFARRPHPPAVSGKAQSAGKRPQAKGYLTSVSIPKSSPLELLIRVKQTVQVKAKTDGKIVFERVLNRGMAESITAKDRIELYVAKAEAIELVLNGKEIGSPGKGKIGNLEITRSGVRIR